MKLTSTQLQAISIILVCLGSISLGMYTEQLLLEDNSCNIKPNIYLAAIPIIMSFVVGALNYKNISAKKD